MGAVAGLQPHYCGQKAYFLAKIPREEKRHIGGHKRPPSQATVKSGFLTCVPPSPPLATHAFFCTTHCNL
jgi:hypothetical protein